MATRLGLVKHVDENNHEQRHVYHERAVHNCVYAALYVGRERLLGCNQVNGGRDVWMRVCEERIRNVNATEKKNCREKYCVAGEEAM